MCCVWQEIRIIDNVVLFLCFCLWTPLMTTAFMTRNKYVLICFWGYVMWHVWNIYIVICIVYWNYRTNAVDTCITTHLHNAFTLCVFLCDYVRLILISKIAEMYLPSKLVECDCFVLIYSKILGGLFANTMWVLWNLPMSMFYLCCRPTWSWRTELRIQ